MFNNVKEVMDRFSVNSIEALNEQVNVFNWVNTLHSRKGVSIEGKYTKDKVFISFPYSFDTDVKPELDKLRKSNYTFWLHNFAPKLDINKIYNMEYDRNPDIWGYEMFEDLFDTYKYDFKSYDSDLVEARLHYSKVWNRDNKWSGGIIHTEIWSLWLDNKPFALWIGKNDTPNVNSVYITDIELYFKALSKIVYFDNDNIKISQVLYHSDILNEFIMNNQ